MTVNAVGPLAGNGAGNPPHLAAFDYFFDATSPVDPEDPVTCGDGGLDPGEQCDDGNANDLDACRNDCRLPACGDGVLDAGEQCDDGNPFNGDGCRDDCSSEGCGDGTLDAGEECDDGVANSENPDATCRTDCTLPGCGDMVVDTGEECDDGNLTPGDGCDESCLNEPTCGDGFLDPGEECDDGMANSGEPDAACRPDCTLAGCGDAVVDSAEECDDGNTNNGDGCSSVCLSEAFCGNGFVDPGEECDDGNNVDGDGCTALCEGIVSDDFSTGVGSFWTFINPVGDGGMTTVGGGTDNARLILSVPTGTSHDAWSANNSVRLTQVADDANFVLETKIESSLSGANAFQGIVVERDENIWLRFDFFTNGSTWRAFAATSVNGSPVARLNVNLGAGALPNPIWLQVERAGNNWTHRYSLDGVTFTDSGSFNFATTVNRVGVQAGNAVGNPALDAVFDYFFENGSRIDPEDPITCGNGMPDPGEECDDGNVDDTDGCRQDCTLQLCGDGILDGGEECDDGNLIGGDGCQPDCLLPVCGDGITDAGEECDDGNMTAGDGCQPGCLLPVCGDGVTDPGEECDDGNLISGDGCQASCLLPACGDGVLDGGEACDDGNTDPGDGCDDACMTEEICGDGIVDTGEECDEGLANSESPDAICRTDCLLAKWLSIVALPRVLRKSHRNSRAKG